MNYNIEYNIKVDTHGSPTKLSALSKSVTTHVPTIMTNLENLRKELHKTTTAFAGFIAFTGQRSKSIKFKIEGNIKKELEELKRLVDSIQGGMIGGRGAGGTGGSSTSNRQTRNNNNRSSTRNGNNRAARGFGGGARGLFGAADVMYTAGFPYPNMIGAAAIGMGSMSILKDAAEYENIMTTVQSILKTTDKETETFMQRFDAMSRYIRKVGVDTKFTTTEVAGAAKYLAMAGLGIEDIHNSIKSIANLAIIGDAPLDQMADIVTNIQTAYGLDSSKMTQIADILTSITTSTNTNVLEMGEAMKFAAPMLSMAKVSFNEAAAAIGALANAGLKGTVAGTALRAMMVRLLNPTKRGLEVLKKYNIELYETDKATGKTKLRSLVDIFGQLRSHNASVQDLNNMFDKIGGNAGNNLFAELMKLPDLISHSVYSAGLSEKIAGKKQDTVAGKWDRVTSQFTETGMTIFEAYHPVIKQGLDELIALLQKPSTAQMFSDLASGLVWLTKSLVQLGTWFSENWNWLSPLLTTFFISKKITEMGMALGRTAMQVRGFVTALGGGAGAGGGLLAILTKIHPIAGLVLGAIGAIGLKVYEARTQTKAVENQLQERMDELFPGYSQNKQQPSGPDTPKSYFEQIGYKKLGVWNSLFSEDNLGQYVNALKKQGELEGAQAMKLHLKEIAAVTDMNLSKESMMQILSASQSKSEAMKLRDIRYALWLRDGKNALNGEFIAPGSVTHENVSQIKQYAESFNQSIDTYRELTDMIIGVQSAMLGGEEISKENALQVIRRASGIDLSSLNLLPNDKRNNQVSNAYNYMRNEGYGMKLVNTLFKAIGEIPSNIIPPTELFGPDKARIDGEIDYSSLDGSSKRGGGGALSGVGKASATQPKILKIEIQSLIGSLQVNSTEKEDMDSFKAKVTQVLIDAVKDFEISYN